MGSRKYWTLWRGQNKGARNLRLCEPEHWPFGQVTIFGQSAGAKSALTLTLGPEIEGLARAAVSGFYKFLYYIIAVVINKTGLYRCFTHWFFIDHWVNRIFTIIWSGAKWSDLESFCKRSPPVRRAFKYCKYRRMPSRGRFSSHYHSFRSDSFAHFRI